MFQKTWEMNFKSLKPRWIYQKFILRTTIGCSMQKFRGKARQYFNPSEPDFTRQQYEDVQSLIDLTGPVNILNNSAEVTDIVDSSRTKAGEVLG
jgi:hypothetical protein